MKSIQLSDDEQTILKAVAEASKALHSETYVVGGWVRDKILNRPCQEMDFVCLGSGIQLAKTASKGLPGDCPVTVFKNFGTAHFKVANWNLEFVGARKESYSKNSRNPEVAPGTLKEDQERRDFSINALAFSLQDENFGEIIDPFNGFEDMASKVLRTPLNPLATFSDDPLRMMRAVRFASQLQFSISPEAQEAIKNNAQRIGIVSQERITEELNKIILSAQPSKGFELLSQLNLLPIFFPEMEALRGVDFVGKMGHKDNFYHTLEVLDNISLTTENLWLRWAAILHDIAKPQTKKFEKGTGWTFHGHEFVGSKLVPGIFRRLKLPLNEKMKYVQKLVLLHLRPISLTKNDITDSAIRRLLFDAGDHIEDLLKLCHADITTKSGNKKRRYRENLEMVKTKLEDVEARDRIRNFQPPVSGEEIMEAFQLKPSRKVGILKQKIKDAILDGLIPNEKQAALDFMYQEAKSMGLM